MSDDTQTLGSSELNASVAPVPVILVDGSPPLRDSIEDQAVKKASRFAAERMAKAMGTDIEARPEPPADAPPETEAQKDARLRDERGRFASPEPPAGTEQQAPVPTQDAPTAAPSVTSAADTADAISRAAAGQSVDLADDARVKVKVNGVEQTMAWADVRRSVQMEQAARQSLANARELERRAAENLAASAARVAPQQPQPNTAPAAPAAGPVDLDALSHALAFGSQQDIKAVLEKMGVGTQRSDAPAVTPDTILGAVDQRLADWQRQQAAQNDTLTFASEHKDLVADPDMQALIAQRVQTKMRDELMAIGADPTALDRLTPQQLGFYHREAARIGQATPTIDVFRGAANAVRSRFATPGASPAIQARLDAKRAAPPAVTAAMARAPAPATPKPKSPGQIVDEDRAARGLKPILR